MYLLKTSENLDFLVLSWGIKWEHWPEMGFKFSYFFIFFLEAFTEQILKYEIEIEITSEEATEGVPEKKLFLKISYYSQENACVGISF